MRVIFMGTPEFAVPSLDILRTAGYEIVGVITATDKMGGRGKKILIQSDVKKYAEKHKLNILQPKNLKAPSFISELKSLKADLQVVVAFRMLPEMVWNMPPHGTYNLHGSLLPKYRGAAPINWAIINGDKTTGVTSFKLKHEIDTGSLYKQTKIKIYPSDNAGDLHDRMKWVAADLVLETVRAIDNDSINLYPQEESNVTHAPKLHKENTKINLEDGCIKTYDLIRGLSPYPVAWLNLDGKKTKVYKADYKMIRHSHPPGTVLTDNKTYLKLATTDGYIDVLEIQMSGKKKMTTKELLNGYTVKDYVEEKKSDG